MKRTHWKELFATQPEGLSVSELARRLNQPNQLTRYWAKVLGYKSSDGRLTPHPDKFKNIRVVDTSKIDWRKSNPEIAKEFGISRQRVWEIRKRF